MGADITKESYPSSVSDVVGCIVMIRNVPVNTFVNPLYVVPALRLF